MANEFTIGSAISFGWDKMKQNFVLYLCIILTVIAVNVLGNALGRISVVGWIFVLAMWVACALLRLGVMSINLNIVDGKAVKYDDIVSQPKLLWDFILATLLYLLIVAAGLILLIIPGIVWAIKYQFYGYAMVDKRLGPMEAIKESGRITQGHKWKLLGLCITFIGVLLLGLICVVVGLFAAIPVVNIAMAFVYRALSSGTPAAPIATPAPTSTPAAPVTPAEPVAPVAPETATPAPAAPKKTAKKVPAKKAPAKKKTAAKKKQ
jgi:uncharacterized membrane protein